jgi:hypothetical protein
LRQHLRPKGTHMVVDLKSFHNISVQGYALSQKLRLSPSFLIHHLGRRKPTV